MYKMLTTITTTIKTITTMLFVSDIKACSLAIFINSIDIYLFFCLNRQAATSIQAVMGRAVKKQTSASLKLLLENSRKVLLEALRI